MMIIYIFNVFIWTLLFTLCVRSDYQPPKWVTAGAFALIALSAVVLLEAL